MTSTIQNIVCTAVLNVREKLDLQLLSTRLKNASYRPAKFSALILRTKGAPTILLFPNGKVVINGSKSYDASCLALRRLTRLLKPYATVNPDTPQIRLVVGSYALDSRVDMDGLKDHFGGGQRAELEPELFPALVVRAAELGGATVLIFGSGKGVITKCTTESQVGETFAKLLPILNQHRRPSSC
jgi:TATA-box binding protein (TBP) (component of TFIID and TFIIIB)